jgi:hypothetical protein
MIASRVPTADDPAPRSIRRLHAELESLGVISDVHHGHGAALLSVWVDLLVWSDGVRWGQGSVVTHSVTRRIEKGHFPWWEMASELGGATRT